MLLLMRNTRKRSENKSYLIGIYFFSLQINSINSVNINVIVIGDFIFFANHLQFAAAHKKKLKIEFFLLNYSFRYYFIFFLLYC
jgi:hypothetical protein